jgi:hypothetical protein
LEVTTDSLKHLGLSDIWKHIGHDRLRDVLMGYDKGVVQTLYVALAFSILTHVGSTAMERRSVKEKQV